MASNGPPHPPGKGQQSALNPKKRKGGPTDTRNSTAKRPKVVDYRQKTRDARTLSAQTSGKAFKNGELDVSSFVRAREYEVQALEEGVARSKKALNRRTFQQVPKELRRRTASHNVKRVPKRLRERGKREMIEDNTPTVTARRRKPTTHMRLRLETAKKLRAMGAKRKAEKERAGADQVIVINPNAPSSKSNDTAMVQKSETATSPIKTRAPKVKKSTLATPPVPKAKFRKRQIHKSWLPTHLYHAKRARMTAPSAPLWRFSIPMTPTAKSYRPTHRASHDRGAVAWDMSYISTIGLDGGQDGLEGVLKALGVREEDLKGRKGQKWRHGTRMLETFVHDREAPHQPIAPVTVMWRVISATEDGEVLESGKVRRRLLLRVHPSAFFQLWEEVLRLAKVAKPQVVVEDLRFEIGSIEIAGPGATEALLGALWPVQPAQAAGNNAASQTMAVDIDEPDKPTVGDIWPRLAGVTNPAMLPQNALLGFDAQDPRLHHPPRTIKLPKTGSEQHKLLELVASWPVDAAQSPPGLFDRKARLAASAQLPSQKAINRRKSLAPPGQYPEPSSKDPKIPILLYTTSPTPSSTTPGKPRSPSGLAQWTLLCPWRCVQPTWYSLMYYPLSTGQQPGFGGLDEKRQLAFEAGTPWFPADLPGTKAGWEWEVRERTKREEEWRRRPKGKRVAWEKVEVGGGRRGEVGVGWACDWERLIGGVPEVGSEGEEMGGDGAADGVEETVGASKPVSITKEAPHAIQKPPQLVQLASAQAHALLASPTTTTTLPPHINPSFALLTVRLTLLTRGVPHPCARIYRLPSSNPSLRKQWLALLPSNQNSPHHQHNNGNRGPKGPKHALPRLPEDAPAHIAQQRLAQSLLDPPRAGEEAWPGCPGEEDLVGFVTTGGFDLGGGMGRGLGSLLVERVMEQVGKGGDGGVGDLGEERVCVVRNAGTGVGRLGRWAVV